MSWTAVSIRSWNHFESFVESLESGDLIDPRFCFRGQSVSKWSLTPSLLRSVPSTILARSLETTELLALAEFKRKIHLYHEIQTLPGAHEVIAWWQLMQHHGSPTRLLDWTFSPYIALYFAIEANHSVDGLVWFFDNQQQANGSGKLYGDSYSWFTDKKIEEWHARSPDSSIIQQIRNHSAVQNIDPHNMIFCRHAQNHNTRPTERMVIQQGTFTFSSYVLADHAKGIDESISQMIGSKTSERRTAFGMIKIPSSLKIPFAKKLHEMNINANSLFPGLDGLGRSVGSFAAIMAHALMKRSSDVEKSVK